MTVLERPVEVEHATEGVAPEAIFPEARRRGRRRRALSAVAVLAAGGLAVLLIVALGGDLGTSRASRPQPAPGTETKLAQAATGVVAWGDYSGVLHLGDIATGRQLQVATFPAADSSVTPAAVDRGRLFWVDAKNRIRSLQIATGKARIIARGTGVMASPDGQMLYVDQGTRDFLELSAGTFQVIRRVAIPAGWTSNPWVARPVAGGLVLMHSGTPAVLGIWRPGTPVRPLGATTQTPLAVYTRPGGRYSLLAWQPACTKHAWFGSNCPLAITSTANRRTIKIPSPTRYGFTSGAFSPNGTQLAVYVNTDNPSAANPPRSELAIINTRTGALRLDPKVNLATTEDAAWVTWLPSGRQLLTGAIMATYLVDAQSLASRPFYFDRAATPTESVMSSPDLNFSTIVVPASALSTKQRRSLIRTRRKAR